MKNEDMNADDQELLDELRALAREDQQLSAPPTVEARVMQAFDRQTAMRRPRGRIFEGHIPKIAAAVALAVLGSVWWSWRPVVPGHQHPELRTATTSWLDMLGSLEVEPGSLQVVHVRVSSEAMAAYGYVLGDPDGDGVVDLDVVLGDDGMARAVRLAPAALIY